MNTVVAPALNNELSKKNSHARDSDISFEESTHKYTILDGSEKYTSVTTIVHSLFEKFDSDGIIEKMMKGKNWNPSNKYWNKTPIEIKQMWSTNAVTESSEGTNLHYQIECFMNQPNLPPGYTHKELLEYYEKTNTKTNETMEWKYFLQYLKDTPELKPYRTEWTIFHEDLKLAGSIDMIYENPDGTLSIYDWKRAKNITRINNFNKFALPPQICHLPDSNFWHYALQLNTYKAILEQKYNKKIKDLFLVRLHPEAEEGNYELIPLPDLSVEIKELFLERISKL